MDFINSREQTQVCSAVQMDPLELETERLGILSIQALEGNAEALQSVAWQLSQNIRHSDYILLAENACAVVLIGASFSEAEIVARRLSKLLVTIEYELQIVSGDAAQTLLGQLLSSTAMRISNEQKEFEPLIQEMDTEVIDSLPYLAFLSNYPSRRLLHLFPYDLACRYRCVPVGIERGSLTIATQQRLSLEVISHFCDVTQRGIFQIRCEIRIINDVLRYWQRLEPHLPVERG